MSVIRHAGTIAECRVKKVLRDSGPISAPPLINFCSHIPIPGIYSNMLVQIVIAQNASWSQGRRYPVKFEIIIRKKRIRPIIQLN
jgi:hypothetical protein